MRRLAYRWAAGARAYAAATMLARAGGVWIWPGVALTQRRSAACIPIATDAAQFWITRLHGPEALYAPVERALDRAALRLNEGDEAGAQKAVDGMGLARLSPDGAALMRAVALRLGVSAMDLPWSDGLRLWRGEDIEAHLPLFEEHSGVRTRRSRHPMSGSPHSRQAETDPGGRSLAGQSQQASRQSRMATHNRRCPS